MLDLHQKGMSKKEKRERCIELLRMVGIPNPEDRLKSYPPSVFRRYAPARDHCNRSGCQSQADHC